MPFGPNGIRRVGRGNVSPVVSSHKTWGGGGVAEALSDSLTGALRLPSIEGREKEHGSHASFLAAGLAVGVCSRQGKRPYQEDEPSVRANLASSGVTTSGQESKASALQQAQTESKPDTHFFALFDGHAGGRCSKFLSTALADVLAEDPSFYSNLPMALKRAFHSSNEQFLKVAERMHFQDGSTGICVILRGGKLTIANVGDCRAVLLSGGKSIQLSKDQKPTQPEEQKRIASLGGSVVYCMGVARVNGVLAVSRAFGNRSLRSVIRPDAEISFRDLQRDDDYLVIASDGLWDVLRNKDVSDICYARGAGSGGGEGAQHLADELVNAAISRGSMDNVTCIVVRLSGYVNQLMQDGVGTNLGNGGSASPTFSDSSHQQGRESPFLSGMSGALGDMLSGMTGISSQRYSLRGQGTSGVSASEQDDSSGSKLAQHRGGGAYSLSSSLRPSPRGSPYQAGDLIEEDAYAAPLSKSTFSSTFSGLSNRFGGAAPRSNASASSRPSTGQSSLSGSGALANTSTFRSIASSTFMTPRDPNLSNRLLTLQSPITALGIKRG